MLLHPRHSSVTSSLIAFQIIFFFTAPTYNVQGAFSNSKPHLG